MEGLASSKSWKPSLSLKGGKVTFIGTKTGKVIGLVVERKQLFSDCLSLSMKYGANTIEWGGERMRVI